MASIDLDTENKPKTTNAKRKRTASSAESGEQSTDENFEDKILQSLLDDDHGIFQKYNKDKQWKLDKIPHHLLPSFNVTECTDINDVREFPILQMSLPSSVFVGTKINDVEVCHRRTIAFNVYMNRLNTIRTAYLTEKKKHKKVRKNEKKGIFSGSLIDFAKRREINPDKHFASGYDFYYTSGNLCANPETSQMLHVSGNNMGRLNISTFSVKESFLNVRQIAAIDLTDDKTKESEIFEMQYSRSESDSFFVRQKFGISLYQYKDDTCYALKKFKSKDVPFISFAQDRVNTNHLALSNLQYQVRFFDLESNKPVRVLKIVASADIKPASTWNMIRSWDSHVYIYATCKKLDIIDTRIPELEWRSNYCGYEESSICSSFCSLSLSNFDNLFYVGSNHKLYCLDRRHLSKNIEGKNAAVSRWTHQMNYCPLMMATNRHNDCEYITLQSPLSPDLRICENIQYLSESNIESDIEKKSRTELPPEYKYKSPCLPYMPPCLENVFQEARLLGKCIKPNSGIVHRIKSCITGLSFVGDSSNPFILTSTSNGDIFARHMYSPEDDYKADQATAADVMSQYEENIFRSVRKAPLLVTEVCDLSGISKVFRCSMLSDLKPSDEALVIPQKRQFMGRWQKSAQSLRKYKDALVSDLLSIWDIEEEEEKDFNIKALAKHTVTDSSTLVSSWLNSAESTMHNMTLIPMDVFNASSAAFETSLEETLKNNDSQVELEQTISASKSKIAKKKARYVKGF